MNCVVDLCVVDECYVCVSCCEMVVEIVVDCVCVEYVDWFGWCIRYVNVCCYVLGLCVV